MKREQEVRFQQIVMAPNGTLYGLSEGGVVWHYGFTGKWIQLDSPVVEYQVLKPAKPTNLDS